LGDLLDQATKLTLALRSQKGRSDDWKFLHPFTLDFRRFKNGRKFS